MIIATIIQSNTIVPAYILTLLLLNLALEGNGDSISRLDVKTLLGNLLMLLKDRIKVLSKITPASNMTLANKSFTDFHEYYVIGHKKRLNCFTMQKAGKVNFTQSSKNYFSTGFIKTS